MVSEGDDAPGFTAPMATPEGDVEPIALPDLVADGPAVLAFFPGAFTSVCTHEMVTFSDRIENITGAGASLYGVSIDTPFALREFAEQQDLEFPLIGDTDRELIGAYGVAMDFDDIALEDVAKRAVFVVDGDGTVTYAWVSEDPGVEPDYEAVEAAAGEA